MLPAICAGLTIAMVLVMVDLVSGPLLGVIAALGVLLLPDFLPLHRTSLLGPPLLVTTIAMLAVMLAAPRFSLAYGAVAAVGAIWVAPDGLGLIAAAVGWALLQSPNGSGRTQRAWLALLPTAVALLLTPLVGSAWSAPFQFGMSNRLDDVLGAIGGVLGGQLVPAIHSPTLRWFVVADATLVILAVVVIGWRRARAPDGPERPRHFFPALALLMGCVAAGMMAHAMLVAGAPLPGVEEALVIAVLATLAVAVAVSVLWARWPWWGKGIASLLLAGWMGAALAR